MANYALRRILQMIPLLLLISAVIYALTALQPGDPVDQLIFGNPKITPEDIARLREAYGVDTPWYEKYWNWLMQAFRGEFGYSRDFGIPVTEYIFGQRLPNTLLLTIPALVISTLIAVPLGIFSAVRQYSAADYILTFLNFVIFSAPGFWIGVMALYLFAVILPQATNGAIALPPGGLGSGIAPEDGLLPFWLDRLKYLILPLTILMLREIAVTTRYMRASFLEVLGQDFVRTARAKGLPQSRVLYKHALRNSLIPIVTILGLAVPGLFSGAVITEQVFSWPGMGRALIESMVSKDFNVVMFCLMMLSLLTVVFQLLTDLLYAVVDPRIRYS
ncbi:ABC transporter permease [Deinococcus wulumuqiensis]|uniref:ABC transporter permease n=1 Tax=Deinococcus wulumuqiensis TaxID=980427 RepID=A0A345IJS1_9DEIO|nr:ABC transporter permease [Deinococcus wulumuqiensis]AXG99943.1 ABC transporter permease [Deinococcus wulumuqiensis]QII20956.1 ABC transporter permease [Deinococcus wulumuqiensis R12]GGI79444.1 peptide ABC transporter permease [Deinococcus wulumuqiensis]GGP28955.1 peptide ABC transporter permease [Deinococcus wulumuqiensis]